LQTFRDTNGLWNNLSLNEVATPATWKKQPELVLDLYNQRREDAANAMPNKAHLAVSSLEEKYEVIVITQNIDDLHERAGSSHVVHLHGVITKARSTLNPKEVTAIGRKAINIGDLSNDGNQLRPHVVWFGEEINNYDVAIKHIKTAAKVLVVGTSLDVNPAARILKNARFHAEKIITQPELKKKPFGFKWVRGKAVKLVPIVASNWENGRKVT